MIQDVSPPAFDVDRFGTERADILGAIGAVMPAAESRPLFAVVLAGSLTLHLLGLFLLNRLEQAPQTSQNATVEIPVDLISDPGKTNKGTAQNAAKPASPAGQQRAQAKSASPSAPAKKPAAQAKPAPAQAQPPKPAAAHPTPKPPQQARPAARAEAQKQLAQPPNPPALRPPLQPTAAPSLPTLAGLQIQAHPIPTPASSPFGIMDDDPLRRAVAVPRPTAEGDEALSYKTIVFGMLELAKQ
ncbi:MAG: hypothetical protein ACRECE_11425, partial [Xanthobacteraceae bacterium]